MKVTGYSIYDDDNHAVIASWLFRFTNGRFGSLTVFVKSNHIAFPVTAYEKAYLRAVIGHLAILGSTLGPSDVTNQMFRDFIDAVCRTPDVGVGFFLSN